MNLILLAHSIVTSVAPLTSIIKLVPLTVAVGLQVPTEPELLIASRSLSILNVPDLLITTPLSTQLAKSPTAPDPDEPPTCSCSSYSYS